MKKKIFLSLLCLLLITSFLTAQNGFSASDSAFLKENISFNLHLAKGTTTYSIPANPDGYKLEFINTDNLSVINKEGKVNTPLSDLTVNVFFKATKLSDKSFAEFCTPVQVKGLYVNQNLNPKPFVIPALCEWHGGIGQFKLTANTRIVVEKANKQVLQQAAQILQTELVSLSKIATKIMVGTPKAGDIYLTLSGDSTELGKEGYYLNIDDIVSIKAAAYKGAFWGTRTILQLLEQDQAHVSIPKGITRDYPKYEVRGFLLDVGRKYFTIDFLRDYVKLMAYYKMSDFQIHLSDNAFVKHYNNNWDSTYCGFRLENTRYPQLPTKGEYYTKKEFIDLQILAEQYGVNIIPEIDVPAHSLAFTKAFPQIASKEFGKDHLDIRNPETYTIIENVFKEYLEGPNPVFRNKEVHIGTDEYAKKEAEAFRKFTDHFIKYVQSFGKDVRVWGALTHAQGMTPVTNKGVTMNAWYNGYAEPLEMKKQGYPLISTPDGYLYIVPAAGYYYDYLNLRHLYNNWEPVNVGDVTFDFGDPTIRGGMFAVWNDVSKNGITSQDVTDRAFPAIQVLSQKMWMGVDSTISFQQFTKGAKNINETPGLNLRAKFPSNDSLVVNYALNGKEKGIKQRKVSFVTEGTSNVMELKSSTSEVKLPVTEIGYNYTVSFMLNPAKNNMPNAVLFQSKHAIVKLRQGTTDFIGFSREGKDYHFGVALPANQWSTVTITGDNNSTILYLNGKLAKKLNREKVPTGYKTDSIWEMRTLVFPLQNIGSKINAYKGKIKNLKVFNKILTPTQISKIYIH